MIQARKAGGCAQLPGLALLPICNVDRPQIGRLSHSGLLTPLDRKIAFKPVDLRFVAALFSLVRNRQSLIERALRIYADRCLRAGSPEQAKIVGESQAGPSRAVSLKALDQHRQRGLRLTLKQSSRCTIDDARCLEQGKAVFG